METQLRRRLSATEQQQLRDLLAALTEDDPKNAEAAGCLAPLTSYDHYRDKGKLTFRRYCDCSPRNCQGFISA